MSMEISIDILQTDVKLISMKSFTDVLMAKANIIDIFKWIEKNVMEISIDILQMQNITGKFHRRSAGKSIMIQ